MWHNLYMWTINREVNSGGDRAQQQRHFPDIGKVPGFSLLLCSQNEQEYQNTFPKVSLKVCLSQCSLRPSCWANGLRANSSHFCSAVEACQHEQLSISVLNVFLTEQGREGCSKPSPESSAQGRAVSLINVSPLSESQKKRPGLVVCSFMFLVLGLWSNEQLKEHFGSTKCVTTEGWSPESWLVERCLI